MVDDKPANLVGMERVLRRLPVEVVCCESGESALRITTRGVFAVALIDVHMPEMNGYELAELLRGSARTRDLPVIFVTASQRSEADARRGYASGAVDYIRKPVDPDELVGKVLGFVRLHEARVELERVNGVLRAEVERREAAEAELRRHRDDLQAAVEERTRSLRGTVERLRAEMSARARLEERLERVHNELQQFVYAAAHDLKTPVRTAGGMAGLVREDIRCGQLEEADADAERIERAASRMARQLDGMVGYAGLDEVLRDRRPVDLAALFGEVAAQLEVADRVSVGELPTLEGGGEGLRLVAEHLLRNGTEAAVPGRPIALEVRGQRAEGGSPSRSWTTGAGSLPTICRGSSPPSSARVETTRTTSGSASPSVAAWWSGSTGESSWRPRPKARRSPSGCRTPLASSARADLRRRCEVRFAAPP